MTNEPQNPNKSTAAETPTKLPWHCPELRMIEVADTKGGTWSQNPVNSEQAWYIVPS